MTNTRTDEVIAGLESAKIMAAAEGLHGTASRISDAIDHIRHLSAENEAMRKAIVETCRRADTNHVRREDITRHIRDYLPAKDKLAECCAKASDANFNGNIPSHEQFAAALRTAILAAGGRDPFGED